MNMTKQCPIQVLGGTGKTGRRIVQRLQVRGVPVRVGTPSASPPFDWTDEGSWPAALDGVGSVYVTYYPDLAVAGAAEACSGPSAARPATSATTPETLPQPASGTADVEPRTVDAADQISIS
jgi:nucleoside-diphosphate-sugar epimerase